MWPRITVVTPSYNQAGFLEETLRSVLMQGYPNLEYMVIDGGSADGSVEIIKRYASWLTFWCSEPDRGQSHAINKGLRRGTGEILGWINSDDILLPGALHAAAAALDRTEADLFLAGMVKVRQKDGSYSEVKRSSPFEGQPIHRYRIVAGGPRHDFHFYQPSMFWTRSIWQKAGEIDEDYHFIMDVEWCNRALASGARVSLSDRPLARFLMHEDSKTVSLEERFAAEYVRMYLRFARRSGFRVLPCLLSTLRPAQLVLVHRAQASQQEGEVLRATLLRMAARALKAVRLLIPGESARRGKVG